MLNAIWLSILFLSVIVGVIQGRIDEVVQAVTGSAKLGFEVALGLAGIMALWLGLMNVATQSGLINVFVRILRPVLVRLFPEVPPEHPAMGSISLNIAANMLGLANAATPFGLKAMQELQELNQYAQSASNAMCTFLAINTSSVQLIPATAMAFLAANGNNQPSAIVLSSFIATIFSSITAIIAVKYFAKLRCFQVKEDEQEAVDNVVC